MTHYNPILTGGGGLIGEATVNTGHTKPPKVASVLEFAMADPNNTESMEQIHSSEREIDALENKINASDESTTAPDDYAAMRSE